MSSMELPLVVFTVASQLGIGLALVSTVRQMTLAEGGPVGRVRMEWIAAAVLVALGMAASLAHLGHPLGAVRAVTHLGKAWLSREVLGLGLFFALVVLAVITAKDKIKPLLAVLAGLAGLATLLSTGMTYAPPGYPAVNNVLPFVFFLLTACILGSGFAVYFTPPERRPLLTKILTASLIVALVLYLVVPCIWLSGGTVMAMTGKAWIGSNLFWLRIVLCLVLPLAVIAWLRTIPLWLPVLLLAGEVLGRIVFFSETIHAAASLGGLS